MPEDLRPLIAALEPRLGALREGPAPLTGGITNHNYRARFGDEEVVMRVAGRDTELLGIDRGAERMATEAAASLGIASAVLAYLPESSCLVTRYAPGVPAEPEEVRRPGTLVAVARALRAFHDRGPMLPVDFDVPRIARDYLTLARGRGAMIPPGAGEAIAIADRVAAALRDPEHEPVPCHNDLLPANLVRDGSRLWLVDWEYAGMGSRYFDLGNLSVNNDFTLDDDERLLDAYWGEPSTPQRLAALRLMRATSDVREALWGVVQGTLSDVQFDFAAYASDHLARLHATVDDPDFERWMARAAAA